MTGDYSVAGGAEYSVAGGTERFVTQGAGYSVARDTGGSVAGGAEYLGGTFLVGSAYHHPSPLHALPHSCKWGNAVPMSISL